MLEYFAPLAKADFFLESIWLFILGLGIIYICWKIIRSERLIDLVIAVSIFSLLIASCYMLLDAPDVAMTEAALGSALSTCVMLNVVSKVQNNNSNYQRQGTRQVLSAFLCVFFTIILSIICFDLPEFGDANNPLHHSSNAYYLDHTHDDIEIPSFVAAILASYRGFDTLGETSVILIAGLSVLFITARRNEENEESNTE